MRRTIQSSPKGANSSHSALHIMYTVGCLRAVGGDAPIERFRSPADCAWWAVGGEAHCLAGLTHVRPRWGRLIEWLRHPRVTLRSPAVKHGSPPSATHAGAISDDRGGSSLRPLDTCRPPSSLFLFIGRPRWVAPTVAPVFGTSSSGRTGRRGPAEPLAVRSAACNEPPPNSRQS